MAHRLVSMAAALLVAVLLLVAGLTWLRSRPPPVAAHFSGTGCTRCHGREELRTHSDEFVERSHGPLARTERQTCLECHQTAACDACHATRVPGWHTTPLRAPDRNPTAWREHAVLAATRRGSCAECHQARFQEQCAACHLREEPRVREEP